MSLLVSDYDGTFDGFDSDACVFRNLKLNCERVSEYVKQGNIFILASSASTNFLVPFCKDNNIPYHYLIGGDGVVGNIELGHPYNYTGEYGYTKEDGILRLQEWLALDKDMEIPDEDIFTIGDSESDFEMIRRWNGFQVGNNQALKEVSLGQYNEVYELIDDINMGKVKRRALK